MHPLKVIQTVSSSLHSGCLPPSGSIIASRLCARPTFFDIWYPSPSGPRWAIVLLAFLKKASEGFRLSRYTTPKIPHIYPTLQHVFIHTVPPFSGENTMGMAQL